MKRGLKIGLAACTAALGLGLLHHWKRNKEQVSVSWLEEKASEEENDSFTGTPVKKVFSPKERHHDQKVKNLDRLFAVNPALYWSALFPGASKAQVVVTNHSSSPREVRLWGASREDFFSLDAPAGMPEHSLGASFSLEGGVHPQDMLYNPVNQFIYTADQLSNTITIINSENEIVRSITLTPEFPGFCSPVALALVSDPASPKYGHVYVACSVADKVVELDTEPEVVAETDTGRRPVGLTYNPINGFLYVANLVDDTLTVIDVSDNQVVTTLPTGTDPTAISIHPGSGTIYTANSGDDTVSVFSSAHALVNTLSHPELIRPVALYAQALDDNLYILAEDSNRLWIVNSTYETVALILLAAAPFRLFFHAGNQSFYVLHRQGGISRVDAEQTPESLDLGIYSAGLFNPGNELIYLLQSRSDSIQLVRYSADSSLSVNEDYREDAENFQHWPALVLHARFSLTGAQSLSVLRITEQRPTGTVKSHSISFGDARHPQHFLNVYELSALKDQLIDGKHQWIFTLPPLHSVSVLIWYKQIQFENVGI